MDLLQWSSEKYEDRVFTAYWNWCKNNAKFPLSNSTLISIEQQLLANASINKWFMNEYTKCEKLFLVIADKVGSQNIDQLEEHYKICTADIFRYYPKILMQGLINNQNFERNFFENSPSVISN